MGIRQAANESAAQQFSQNTQAQVDVEVGQDVGSQNAIQGQQGQEVSFGNKPNDAQVILSQPVQQAPSASVVDTVQVEARPQAAVNPRAVIENAPTRSAAEDGRRQNQEARQTVGRPSGYTLFQEARNQVAGQAYEQPVSQSSQPVESNQVLAGSNLFSDVANQEETNTSQERSSETESAPRPESVTVTENSMTVESGPEQFKQERERFGTLIEERDMAIESDRRVVQPVSQRRPSVLNKVFSGAGKWLRDAIKGKVSKKKFKGDSFYETILADSAVSPDSVSIGSELIVEAVMAPQSSLVQLVNSVAGTSFTAEELATDVSPLIETINRPDVRIKVTLDKSPLNKYIHTQIRILRVHEGRGLKLHPSQAKGYTADFDGDEATLHLDQRNLKGYSFAMSQLLDASGNPSIDTDFFPIDEILDEQRESELEVMREKYFTWNPIVAERLFDTYADMGNDRYWQNLFKKFEEIAKDFGIEGAESRSTFYSKVFQSLYNYARMRRFYATQSQLSSVIEQHSNFASPSPDMEPITVALMDMMDEVVAGRPVKSLTQFVTFYNRFFGNPDESSKPKNVPFRFISDFGKAVNRNDLVMIYSQQQDSDGNISFESFYKFSARAMFERRIAGQASGGSRQVAAETKVRTEVLTEVGFKQPGETFPQFIERFVKSYNLHMREFNNAKVGFRWGMMPVTVNKGKDVLHFQGVASISDDLAKALADVYGDFTLSYVFGGDIFYSSGRENRNGKLLRKYADMPIGNFIMQNRLEFEGESRITEVKSRISSGNYSAMDIILLLADRRTSQLADYNKNWLDATEKHLDNFYGIDFDQFEDVDTIDLDWAEYAHRIVGALELFGQNIFNHFGMTSLATFMDSKWGKELIYASKTKNLELFRSHLISMMIEYRLDKSTQMLAQLKAIKDDQSLSHDVAVLKLEKLNAAYENEMDVLGSSSPVWAAISGEVLEGNRYFRELRDNTPSEGTLRARSFWESDESNKYYSLVNLLKSSVDYQTKIDVLYDIVRQRTDYKYFQDTEILGQLAHNPDPIYGGNRFDGSAAFEGLSGVKDSVKKATMYRSMHPEKIRKKASRLTEWAKQNVDEFKAHLTRLASDPGYQVYVDPILAADALASIYDPTSNDTEKIQQQSSVNAWHGVLSLQKNGGLYTHLQQVDNKILNIVGYDQLTPYDIARILADETIEINSYDEYGTPAILSRESLCGDNSIESVIKYIDRNPKIALACQRFIAGVNADVNGTATMTAMPEVSSSIADTISYKTFSLLNDRPRFMAFANLITPVHGNVSRNMPEKLRASIEDLCLFVSEMAAVDGIVSESTISKQLESRFGISPAWLAKMDPERIKGILSLHDELVTEILDCIDIVKKSRISLDAISSERAEFDERNNSRDTRPDMESVVAYYFARQMMHGARTDSMIGVEGAETHRVSILKLYARTRQDVYMTASEQLMPMEAIISLNEMIPEMDLFQEMQASDNGCVVIKVPEGWNSQDGSLETRPAKQLPAIIKFLETMRDDAAETWNAMLRKFAIDDRNSTVKISKYDKESIAQGELLRNKIGGAASRDEAVYLLAKAMIDASKNLDYIAVDADGNEVAFYESDYWNLADLMIATDGETGVHYIRSIEQIASALRHRISDEAIAGRNISTVIKEMDEIVAAVGTPADPMATNSNNAIAGCLSHLRSYDTVGNMYRIDRALRPRSSDIERNAALMHNLIARAKKVNPSYSIPSREKVENISRDMASRLGSVELSKKISSLVSWSRPGAERQSKNTYDLIGVVDGKNTIDTIVPGPLSLVVFKNNPTGNALSEKQLTACANYGMTAAFNGLESVPDKYAENAIDMGNGIWIVPFFDMILDRQMRTESIMPAPYQSPLVPNSYVVSNEDTTHEYAGDSMAHISESLGNRTNFEYSDSEVYSAYDVFAHTQHMFPNEAFTIEKCTRNEIEQFVAGSVPLIIEDEGVKKVILRGRTDVLVDLGVAPENETEFNDEFERFKLRLIDYQNQALADDSTVIGNCKPDRIIGFVKTSFAAGSVLAPITAFNVKKSGSVPTTFEIESFDIDKSRNSYVLNWRYTGSLTNQFIKMFEGIGASNKMEVFGDYMRSRQLRNGMEIDLMYNTESIASRLFASNKRISTMISAFLIPRLDSKYSYNFATLAEALPNNPELKEDLLNNPRSVTLQRWIDEDVDVYHRDTEINLVAKHFVELCKQFGTVNPTYLLATSDGAGKTFFPMDTEFEAFMHTSYNFQNGLMKMLHAMQPTLVPDGIEGDSTNCLFIPVTDASNPNDYGILQTIVPHYDADGNMREVLENVYISHAFFGGKNLFSGFKQVNINAAERTLQGMVTATDMTEEEFFQVLEWGRSDVSGIASTAQFLADPSGILEDRS